MTNESSSKMSIEDMIGHYQRSIERSQHDPNRILHCIGKLSKLRITVQHLTSTGIGRTVNALRKDDGDIGAAAKTLISKWKQMVSQESEDERVGNGDDDNDNDDGDSEHDDKADEEEHHTNDYNYACENGDDAIQVETETISARKSHKSATHDYQPKSGTSNNNHRHRDQNHHHHHHHHHATHKQKHEQEHGKMSDSQKFSGDDTDDHSIQSKHKDKSHSRADDSREKSSSRKRVHENQDCNGIDDRKHSKSERHHRRSKNDEQLINHEISDKKHKHENKDKQSDKRSDYHTSHSSSNEKAHKSHNKHKRARETDDLSESPHKKHKKDSHNSKTTTSSSSSRNDEKKSSKSKYRNADDGIEIDNSMGTSFADALGMLQPIKTSSKSNKVSITAAVPSTSKSMSKSSTIDSSLSIATTSSTGGTSSTSSSKSKTKHKSKASTSGSSSTLALSPPSLLLAKPSQLPQLEDISKDLPPPSECIIPNDYRPTPINPMILECVFKGSKSQAPMLSETAALCASTTSKNQRTKVYSGVKSGVLLTVPPLHELCIRFLQKNIDALEYTGGVPFEILKPVLERASPKQLEIFENFNPYLMVDSDILWQQHCQRKFKGYKRQEMETWREMFERCKSEQDARLDSLTRNIKESQSVAQPVRQTKLAYVDSLVKPPRNVIKKQNQFNTHQKLTVTPAARVEALSSVSSNMARSGDARLKALASMRDTAQAQLSTNGAMKPKKAPLMTKALQLMKGRFKR